MGRPQAFELRITEHRADQTTALGGVAYGGEFGQHFFGAFDLG